MQEEAGTPKKQSPAQGAGKCAPEDEGGNIPVLAIPPDVSLRATSAKHGSSVFKWLKANLGGTYFVAQKKQRETLMSGSVRAPGTEARPLTSTLSAAFSGCSHRAEGATETLWRPRPGLFPTQPVRRKCADPGLGEGHSDRGTC